MAASDAASQSVVFYAQSSQRSMLSVSQKFLIAGGFSLAIESLGRKV